MHESGAAAAAAFAKHKSDIEGIAAHTQTIAEVQKKVKDFQEKSMGDEAASIGGTTADDCSEGEDDMQFSSYAPTAITKNRNNRRKLNEATTESEKRRRFSVFSLGAGGGSNGNTDTEEPELSGSGEVGGGDVVSDKVAKVLLAWDQKQEAFSDAALWEGKIKQRAFTSLSKALEDGANKIIGEESERCQIAAKNMLDFTDKVKAKFDLCQKLKKNVRSSVADLSDADQALLTTLQPQLINKIIVYCCSQLLKDVEDIGCSQGEVKIHLSRS